MAKKLTANQIAYQKEISRLKRAIKRNEKQGYLLPQDFLPAQPKKVTKKAIERLKEIKPKDLRVASVKIDIETGVITKEPTEKELRNIQKKITGKAPAKKQPPKAKKPKPPKITVIDRVRAALYDLANESGVPISSRKAEIINIFDETLEDMGSDAYGDYLETVEEEIFYHIERVTYHSSPREVEQSFANLGRLLNGTPLSKFQADRLSVDAEYSS